MIMAATGLRMRHGQPAALFLYDASRACPQVRHLVRGDGGFIGMVVYYAVFLVL